MFIKKILYVQFLKMVTNAMAASGMASWAVISPINLQETQATGYVCDAHVTRTL